MLYRAMLLILAIPHTFQPIDLTNTNQPASAVVVDVKLETEVKMKLEPSSVITVTTIIRAARQSVKVWLSAARNSYK